MLRCVRGRLARRKHGQTAWSPNRSSGGAAPANGVTAQEALHIAYRPMPPAHTVEYEEDFGPSMMIHREFVSARHRSRLSADIGALAYSDVELSRARQQLASVMNRERRGAALGTGGAAGDRVPFHSDVDETTREVKSARFLFNETRMAFCDRFQAFFRERIERQLAAAGTAGAGEDRQYYFSLMEACAVLHGCDTADARETHYRRFLGLDLDSLEAEAAAARARATDAETVDAQLRRGGPSSTAEAVQGVIDALPPLFPQHAAIAAATGATGGVPRVGAGASVADEAGSGATPVQKDGSTTGHFTEDVAPLYRAYLAHARGESPVGTYDVLTVGAHAAHAERRRWRALMDKISAEDYHKLSAAELEDAYELNGQLHTVKFFDMKVGDTVREIVQLMGREMSAAASGDRDAPVARSPSHPERRV